MQQIADKFLLFSWMKPQECVLRKGKVIPSLLQLVVSWHSLNTVYIWSRFWDCLDMRLSLALVTICEEQGMSALTSFRSFGWIVTAGRCSSGWWEAEQPSRWGCVHEVGCVRCWLWWHRQADGWMWTQTAVALWFVYDAWLGHVLLRKADRRVGLCRWYVIVW